MPDLWEKDNCHRDPLSAVSRSRYVGSGMYELLFGWSEPSCMRTTLNLVPEATDFDMDKSRGNMPRFYFYKHRLLVSGELEAHVL